MLLAHIVDFSTFEINFKYFKWQKEREGRTKEEKNPNIHQYCVGSPQCNPMWLVHKNEYYVVIKNDLDLWGLIGKGHKIY